ncbi:hypothetical protein PENSPDRAFT_183938 [Peniophora sp. CONT]|nr:hypothetical protein PENSPDRAFT_183938 [Peniophora sp. CONT]
MWNGTIVYDALHLEDCTPQHSTPLTLDQAGFIEGLSVWANVTRNGTLTTLLESVISSVTTFPGWSSSRDIVTENADPLDPIHWSGNLKGLLIRALFEARVRNPGADIARYVEAYITMQFNAVLSNAQGSGSSSSFYATSWVGQRASTFTAAGSITALDVLNAALSLPVSSSSIEASKHEGSHTGTIAGVVVGCAVFAIAVVFLLLRRCRNHARSHNSSDANSGSHSSSKATIAVEPFIYPTPATQSSKWQEYYAPNRHEDRSSLPIARNQPHALSVPTGERARRRERGTFVRTAPAENVSHIQEVAQAEPHSLDDLPNIVGRLVYDLLHGHQGELPPAYGN